MNSIAIEHRRHGFSQRRVRQRSILSATGNIDLLAAANTSDMRSSNSGSNASMGATFALGGQQNGLSFQAGAQGSKGKANGSETTYSNTQIRVGSADAPGTLNISSGGNTTLRGATASANTVNADIKGKLVIESLQDTSNYDSKQTSVGAGVSVCVPPLCYGTMVVVNVNAAKTKIDGDYTSVGEQSALRAGDGGFNVKVGGKTELVGGQITSTDKAVTDKKNQFTSTGGVTTTDLQNKSALDASSVSVSLNTGSGSTGGMAGYGSVNDKQTSTTRAGITGVAGNTAARTGDASTGLKPVFTQADVEKINKSLSTQTAITSEFGKNSAKFVGDTAGKKQKELTDQASAAKAAGQADEASRLTAEALLWAEGGAYRVSMHLVAGAMGGGVNGAAGAAASASTAGVMDKVQAQMQASLEAGGMNKEVAKATASLLTAGASAAIAGAAGGVQGATAGLNVDLNNRQLHPTEIKRIKDLAGKDAQKEARLTAAACAMARCYAEYPEGSTAYNELKILADAGSSASFANERQLLQNQTGLFTYTTAGLVNDQNIDAAKQINNTYQIGTRVVGAGQATLGAVAIAGGVVTAPASCATGVGCVANAFVIASGADAVYTGSKQVVSGQAENSLTSQALQSLGMSQEAAMYAEFALGVGASAKVGQVLNSATNQLAKTNNVSSASYKDFTTQSINLTVS